ncbi:MAG TPA: hypothetical protein VJN18_00070 [Polyangiaceae bacterium]|nr:hypothetical protein [Polyangiaceae bacterium]
MTTTLAPRARRPKKRNANRPNRLATPERPTPVTAPICSLAPMALRPDLRGAGVTTLGLGFVFSFVTRLVVSAIVLLIADKLSCRLPVRGFVPALLAASIIALTGSVGDLVLR